MKSIMYEFHNLVLIFVLRQPRPFGVLKCLDLHSQYITVVQADRYDTTNFKK